MKNITRKALRREDSFDVMCECGSYSHIRTQCDKLKNYETAASTETVRNGIEVLSPYTSLGTVNGTEIPVLRDTGATLDLICKKIGKAFHVYK
ncbi:SCAN box domain-containing protein [Trichonephila clavipes]|uniref:SCAN box domain-containing protein n=1 Tax=Trichonephila clavipes TaxID=2585209 RepID=A0A8X6SEF5_TRICX|nr:SCAN box domain-containing protein [Trichonephila clavipes]